MSHPYSAELRTLGTLVRRRRNELGLTQSGLGARMGWAQERISALENGKYGLPSLPMLAQLAAAMDMPLTETLDAAGFPLQPPALDASTMKRDLHAQLREEPRYTSIEEVRRLDADEIVASVAHDLRNQITAVKGRIDMVLRRLQREGNERDASDIEKAAKSLDHMQDMITGLLDASRLEGGMFSIDRRPTDLVELARRVVADLQGTHEELELRAPNDLTAWIDPARITQVLHNLISNASQHTPEGTHVTIGVTARTGEGGTWAVVEVRDEGPGIAPDVQDQLFARYAAGPGSTGLGLGLYLARGIAEAHGGSLTVASEPGDGTTFELVLPVEG